MEEQSWIYGENQQAVTTSHTNPCSLCKEAACAYTDYDEHYDQDTWTGKGIGLRSSALGSDVEKAMDDICRFKVEWSVESPFWGVSRWSEY